MTHMAHDRLITDSPQPLPSKRYTVNSLFTDTVIRRTPLQDGHLVLVPIVFQSFYCNSSLYKTDNPLRQTTDTNFEIVNRPLGRAMCGEKSLKTEM